MKDINETQRARAKRSDIDAMQKRFDAILRVIDPRVLDAEGTIVSDKIHLVRRLASGSDLDAIIQEAGRAALGLSND